MFASSPAGSARTRRALAVLAPLVLAAAMAGCSGDGPGKAATGPTANSSPASPQTVAPPSSGDRGPGIGGGSSGSGGCSDVNDAVRLYDEIDSSDATSSEADLSRVKDLIPQLQSDLDSIESDGPTQIQDAAGNANDELETLADLVSEADSPADLERLIRQDSDVKGDTTRFQADFLSIRSYGNSHC